MKMAHPVAKCLQNVRNQCHPIAWPSSPIYTGRCGGKFHPLWS